MTLQSNNKLLDSEHLIQPIPASHRFKIRMLGLERELELRELDKGHWIASNHSIILSDVEFLSLAAEEISNRIRGSEPEIILTAESKSIYLAGKVTEELGLSNFEVCRKSMKPYLKDPVVVKIKSTISGEESLILDSTSKAMISGRRVALIDDVVTTGGNMVGMERLIELSGGKLVSKACIWVEGVPMSEDALRTRRDLAYLSMLPEFFEQGRLLEAKSKFEAFRKSFS